MQHKTHKRFIRTLPMDIALAAAAHLARATVDFVLETKPACRSREAYLSCHFEETLIQALLTATREMPEEECRLGVALDTESLPMRACAMPQGHPTHCGCIDPEKRDLPRTRKLSVG